MLSAVQTTPVAVAGDNTPSAAKLAALTHKAGTLRQKMLLGQKTGTSADGASQVDSVSQQLNSVEAQIARLVLTEQLARLGQNLDPNQNGSGSGSGNDSASQGPAAAAGVGKDTGDGGAQPRPNSPAAIRRQQAKNPYKTANPPGNLVNISS